MARVVITREIIRQLQALHEQSGIGPAELMQRVRRDKPRALRAAHVIAWLKGSIRTAPQAHLHFVLERWESLARKATARIETVRLTHSIRARLHQLHNASGVGPEALLHGQTEFVPSGLTVTKLMSWMSGREQIVERSHLDYVMSLWSMRADRQDHPSDAVPLIPETLAMLSFLAGQSGTAPHAILEGPSAKPPDGLTETVLDDWLEDRATTASLAHLRFAVSRWKELSDRKKTSTDKITLTKSRLEKLKALRKSTGIGPTALLRGPKDRVPAGLSSSMIQSWLDGRGKTATRAHYEFAVQAWQSVPARAKLTTARRKALIQELERIGKPAYSIILSNVPDVSATLKASVISHWVRGVAKTVILADYEAVMKALRGLPDFSKLPPRAAKPPKIGKSPEKHPYITHLDAPRIKLDADMRDQLIYHRDRTGVGAAELLGGYGQNAPERLKRTEISQWINSNPKTVNAAHYKWVIDTWSRLPTAD